MPTLDEYMAMLTPQQPDTRTRVLQALGQLGVGLLSAPNWQKGLARGGLLAYDAQQGAADRAAQDQIAKLRTMQMAQQMSDSDAAREKQAKLDAAAAGAFMPGAPEMGPPTAQGAMQPATSPTFDFNKYINAVAPIDPVRAFQLQKEMQKKPEESPWAKINPKDYTLESLRKFSQTKDAADLVPAQPQGTPDSPFAKINPGDYTPQSLAKFVEGGGKDYSVLRKAVAPSGGASAEAGPKWDPTSGQFVYPPTAQAPTGKAVRPEGYTTKAGQTDEKTQKVTAAISEARDVIPNATGSYFGTGADMFMQAFGSATEGAQATAKLKVLESVIMMNQPRMEGQQSNLDVLMYRQAAGQIGDPTIPRKQKLAALDAIDSLLKKYGSGAARSAGASASWSITPVNE